MDACKSRKSNAAYSEWAPLRAPSRRSRTAGPSSPTSSAQLHLVSWRSRDETRSSTSPRDPRQWLVLNIGDAFGLTGVGIGADLVIACVGTKKIGWKGPVYRMCAGPFVSVRQRTFWRVSRWALDSMGVAGQRRRGNGREYDRAADMTSLWGRCRRCGGREVRGRAPKGVGHVRWLGQKSCLDKHHADEVGQAPHSAPLGLE